MRPTPAAVFDAVTPPPNSRTLGCSDGRGCETHGPKNPTLNLDADLDLFLFSLHPWPPAAPPTPRSPSLLFF
jgi:hypothetical protein